MKKLSLTPDKAVEYLKDKTAGVSAYVIDSAGTVENKRVEKLIYQKD